VIVVTTGGFEAGQTLPMEFIMSQHRRTVDVRCGQTNQVSVSASDVFNTTQLVTFMFATARKRGFTSKEKRSGELRSGCKKASSLNADS
jgi:hypothetical protein